MNSKVSFSVNRFRSLKTNRTLICATVYQTFGRASRDEMGKLFDEVEADAKAIKDLCQKNGIGIDESEIKSCVENVRYYIKAGACVWIEEADSNYDWRKFFKQNGVEFVGWK